MKGVRSRDIRGRVKVRLGCRCMVRELGHESSKWAIVLVGTDESQALGMSYFDYEGDSDIPITRYPNFFQASAPT